MGKKTPEPVSWCHPHSPEEQTCSHPGSSLNAHFKFAVGKSLNLTRRTGRRGINIPNPLSTFCYLSAQGDAFGQLVDGQLAVEVALLRGGADLDDDRDGNHDCDEEEAHAVDDDLQVGVVGWRIVWDSWMGGGAG